MYGISLVSHPMAGFGVNGIEPSGCAVTAFVSHMGCLDMGAKLYWLSIGATGGYCNCPQLMCDVEGCLSFRTVSSKIIVVQDVVFCLT